MTKAEYKKWQDSYGWKEPVTWTIPDEDLNRFYEELETALAIPMADYLYQAYACRFLEYCRSIVRGETDAE